MFGMSGTEIAIILILALLLLGPSKLPELARSLGKGLRDFRRATSDLRTSVESEFYRLDQPAPKKPAVELPKPPEGAVPAGGAAANVETQATPKAAPGPVSDPYGLAAAAEAPKPEVSAPAEIPPSDAKDGKA